MPPVLICQNHPLVHDIDHVNRVFVMHQSTKQEDLEEAYQFEQTLDAPAGDPTDWDLRGTSHVEEFPVPVLTKHLGLLNLVPGDYVFCRDPRVSTNPQNDAIAVVISGPSVALF